MDEALPHVQHVHYLANEVPVICARLVGNAQVALASGAERKMPRIQLKERLGMISLFMDVAGLAIRNGFVPHVICRASNQTLLIV